MEDLNKDPAPATTTEWDTLLEDMYENDRAFRQNFILSREMLDAKLDSLTGDDKSNAYVAENLAFKTVFEKSELPQASVLLSRLNPEQNDGDYDYIARLTAKDAAGNYLVDDSLSREFFDFYGKAVRKLEADFRAEMSEDLKSRRYVMAVDKLIEQGILPEIFRKNVAVLDPASPSFKPPQYHLYDIAYRITAGGHTPSGGAVKFNIGLYRPHHGSNVMDAVIDHEHTHYIAGSRIKYGDESTSRDLNEALTESISYLISVASGRIADKTLDDVEFGDGISYRKEREAMKPLVDTPGGRDFYLTAYALKTE